MSEGREASPADKDRRGDAIGRTARASGFLAGGNFFEISSRALIALLLARWLGADGYGLYVLAISAGSLFSGVSLLGLDRAMIRYVAILASRRDRPGLHGTIRLGLVVSSLFGALLGMVLFLTAELVANGLFDEPALVMLLELMAILIPFLTMSSVLIGVAQGFSRMDYSALAENVIQTLVRLSLLGALAAIGFLDVFAAVIIFGIADVAATVALILLLRRDWSREYPASSSNPTARTDTREILGFALPLWLSSLLRRIRRNIETFLLGSLSTVSTVGIYSVVAKINLVGHVSYLAILGGVRPTLAALHDAGDREALSAVYTTATRWTLAVNLPFFLVIVMFPSELLGIFGEDFRQGATALVVLAVAEVVNAATGVCQSMIDMTGHSRVKLFNSFLWMTLAAAGGFALIPRFGILGAAIASFVAIVVVNLLSVVQVWAMERLNPFDRRSLKPIGAALASLAAGLVVQYLLQPADEYVTVSAVAAIIVITYCVTLMSLGLEEDDRRILSETTSRVRKKLRFRRGCVAEGGRSRGGADERTQ